VADARIVVCGAGIAGVSAAYRLAGRHGFRRIVLVDDREPLTLTSDKGTQGYRNWWPGPDATMCRFVSHGIDLLEELAEASGDGFRLSRRGYLFATSEWPRVGEMRETALRVASYGMGPLREHPGDEPYRPAPREEWRDQPVGADLIVGTEEVRRHFGFLTPDVRAALHVRRAGTLDVVALGRWLLEGALRAGASLVRDRVVGVGTEGGRVRRVRLASGATLDADAFVIAAGPALAELGRMLDVELPVFHELHGKLLLDDARGAVPRDAPMVIWTDPVRLPWTDDERDRWARSDETRWLVEPLPGGVHVRPVDRATGRELFLIWTYDVSPRPPVWPPAFDAWYGETCIRGAARMIPALAAYFGRAGEGLVDGGYYCKTRDNRPLIGPLPVGGAYVLGALSGYGIMASQGAADLLARHVAGEALPDWADAFHPSRFDDPAYRARIEGWDAAGGQL
jgi:glycine/D-amino acid oxidase-like deaminating enzyme